MKKLWGRVGVEVDFTDEEYYTLTELINNKDWVGANNFLEEILKEKAKLNGETYFPANLNFGRDDCDNPDEELNFEF